MPVFSDDSSAAIASSLQAVPAGTPVSQVAHRLLELFTGGELEVGTRLPPERQLAASLGVGRSAVREALAALEILGIVDVRPGSGTYLRGAASDLLPQTLRWGLMIGEKNTAQLIELRAGLESYTARLAAGRVDAAQLETLRGSVAAMRDAVAAADGDEAADGEAALPDPVLTAFVAADAEFHAVLARAAENPMLTDLLDVTRTLLRVYNDRAVHHPGDMHLAGEEHAAILAALEEADGDRAASAMVAHMETARSRLLRAAGGDDPSADATPA
ncbi:FadR/GntR family transcriptional regulator [Brachybacterium sp. J153]|uniref:FadR/GntR family transcriptional regulator n=1 Tax=Brachybacterium sp. J153 TaxID=3116488 RepID=UPI002E7A4D8A|nr:FCD domain-containing protein [Brachybacterium sp. J153]MEE1618620.1 FCD domain-containing protein [Brachybacterium sp. J153]